MKIGGKLLLRVVLHAELRISSIIDYWHDQVTSLSPSEYVDGALVARGCERM